MGMCERKCRNPHEVRVKENDAEKGSGPGPGAVARGVQLNRQTLWAKARLFVWMASVD